MMQRIRQFYRAVRARITPVDKQWLEGILPADAQKLFYAMHPADQYHALNVARTAMRLSSEYSTVDKALLLRAALLHDVGRVQGDMDIMGKVLAVLVKHYFPQKAQQLAKKQNGWLGHIMYVYYHHPEIGASKLETIGMVEEAAIIRWHHAPSAGNESPELVILRAADDLN